MQEEKEIITVYEKPGKGGLLAGNGIKFQTDVRDAAATCTDIGGLRKVVAENGDGIFVKDWGSHNDLPQQIDEILRGNHIAPSLINTKVKITLGQRPYMYYERWEDDAQGVMKRIIDEVPMPSEIEEFFDRLREEDYFKQCAAQYYKNGNPITEFKPTIAPSVAGAKIATLKAHEARYWRMSEMTVDGVFEYALFKGDGWGKVTKKRTNTIYPVKAVPMWQGYDDTDVEKPFIFWTGDPDSRFDSYYYSPIWYGSMGIIKLNNNIPLFHDANIKHGYLPRFHIRIRKGMFLNPNYYKTQDDKQKQTYLDEETTARAEWLKQANELLAGFSNAGRAIWSEEEIIKNVEKKFPDVEIIAIKAEMHDEALLKQFREWNEGIISSMQIYPTLANIQTQGKIASGSEIRNALLMYRLIHTPDPREILLKPIYMKAKIDGWNEKYKSPDGRKPKFGFADEDIVALSQDKTGSANVDPNAM